MCSRDREGTANGSVTLSRVSILVGFICASSYFGAFVGTGWVYTKEPYRLTNLNLYTTVTFKIGLWRACHSFKRINSTITPMPSCTMISYTNWSQLAITPAFQRSDIDSTISVIGRIRWCAMFVGSGFILILIGFVCSIAGHFYKDNKTLLASAMYTLSGLSLAAGLFVLVCVLTDSFSIHTSISGDPNPNDALDSRRKTYHDYEYGWCFLVASSLCVFVEMVALLCMAVHHQRCQTIAQIIKNILPVEEQQKPTTTETSYFSSGDVNYIEKIDPCKSENKTKPNDESFATSETPPDICSTFLNVEYAEDAASRPCDVTEHLDICSLRMKKGNFATLNTRNYRCLKYPSSLSRRYSTMSGCSSIPGSALDGPSSSSSSSSTRPNTKCHQSATSCIQSTMPRVRNPPGSTSLKYATVDRQCKKNEIQAEVQTLDGDNFGL